MWNRKLKQASKFSRGSCTRVMEDSCVDFISQLPDHLLLHIFSFLDETAVFQSSVLSRRWRYLWNLVPFPTATKEMISYFKGEKAVIRKMKLREEEGARNTISELTIDVAKAVSTVFLAGLPFITNASKVYVIHTLFTLAFLLDLYKSYSMKHSSLCGNERWMKMIQLRDSKLTSSANKHSISKIPMLQHLFPENYKPPRYAKFANLYGLIGMLLLIIISCSVVILNWNFDFNLGTNTKWMVTCLSTFCMVIVNVCV